MSECVRLSPQSPVYSLCLSLILAAYSPETDTDMHSVHAHITLLNLLLAPVKHVAKWEGIDSFKEFYIGLQSSQPTVGVTGENAAVCIQYTVSYCTVVHGSYVA